MVALAVVERPGVFLVDGAQDIREVNLEKITALLEGVADGAAVAGIPRDQLSQLLFVGGEVGGPGRLRRLGHEADKLCHDPRGPDSDQQARELTVEIEGSRGKQRPELGGDLLLRLRRRFAEPDHRELIGADEIDLPSRVELGEIEAIKGGEHLRLHRRLPLAGDGDRRMDSSKRIGAGKPRGGPGLERLVLERDPGGVADEAVGIGKLREGRGDGRLRVGPLHMKSLEPLADLAALGAGGRLGIDRGGRFLADVGHPVELPLAATATDGEVDGAILADRHVGERERRSRHELLLLALVGRAVGRQMDRVHRSERPVADEERLLVLGGKLRAVAEGGADRRAGADVDERREAVGQRRRPLAGTGTPAELAATRGMVDARRPIPRRPEIPLHVGVVDEHLAVGVEGEVVGIAIAAGPDFPLLAIGIGADDIAPRRENPDGMPPGVPEARDEKIFVPVGRQPARGFGGKLDTALVGADATERLRLGDIFHGERREGVVAADDEQLLAIGGEADGMGAVLAAPLKGPELFDMIEDVVAVGVGRPVEAAAGATVADDIQRVERPEEPLSTGQLDRDLLDDRRLRAVERRRRDPHKPLVPLVAGDQPPLRIGGEADPRPEQVLRHGEQLLNLEAGKEIERLRRGSPGLAGEGVFPRAFPGLGDDADGDHLGRLASWGPLPAAVGGDHLLAPIGGREDDPAGEPSRASLVCDDGDQLVVAGLEVFRDIDSHRIFPGFALGDLLAVEEERHPIVGRGGDDRFLDAAGERLGEPVFTVVARAPDPVGHPLLRGGHLDGVGTGRLLLGELLPAFGGCSEAEPGTGRGKEEAEEDRGDATKRHGRHSRQG